MSAADAALFLVDVFTRQALRGNPVAVVVPAAVPTDAAMQALAAWIGMPETVFVMPGARDAGADYRVRIWSPLRELPFAGHPSIGAAHALIANGMATPHDGRLVQQSPYGLVTMRASDGADGEIRFETPVPDVVMLDGEAAQAVAAALGPAAGACEAARVEAGARWLVARLGQSEGLDALTPDLDAILRLSRRHDVSGLTVIAPAAHSGADFEVRSFGPAIGVAEDAACGGGNACAAALIAASHGWREGSAGLRAAQGRHVGRDATIHWHGPDAGGRLEIGGYARLVSAGSLRL
ncbi:PhzF family phenazine biosynthesis protein [Burkholderia perseverans]|uniref:PhzF family phenazine biosynthesis protein n=1 Tax=Burkholderia perseverans TaxID=2615214 RepID=UPI001FEF3543|nr:PhzF family phenazine biosynthesis protein [Burkholderia perseverans]